MKSVINSASVTTKLKNPSDFVILLCNERPCYKFDFT